jgi:hypothetical protein
LNDVGGVLFFQLDVELQVQLSNFTQAERCHRRRLAQKIHLEDRVVTVHHVRQGDARIMITGLITGATFPRRPRL